MILHHSNVFKFIFILISIQSLVEARLSEIIETPEGQVQGLVMNTVLRGMEYSSFRGIPYAKPPVGYLRFQRPVKFIRQNNNNEVLQALENANMCSQFDSKTNMTMGDEDCLYLNVYTPEVEFQPGHEKRAVMVWIHGGAFMWGSNNSTKFGPDYLLEKNVVVVAMNYRLGAFGFITAGNYIEGNMGLKDQVMALQWVKDNIIFFGGDPNKVTIFGESAGAVSVELHRLSPLSQGLFRASIAMSGSPLNPWAFYPRKKTEHVSDEMLKNWKEMEATPTPKQKFLDLMRAPADKIVERTEEMSSVWKPLPYTPTVENPSPGAFLTEHPSEYYKHLKFSTVPHIIGGTGSEAIGIPEVFYPLHVFNYTLLNMAVEVVLSKIQFWDGIDKTLNHILRKRVRVWAYSNSFDYPQSLHRIEGIDIDGCGHADDVAHIFYVQGKNQPLDFDSEFAKHRERIVTLWTNFAKYLNVTADTSSIGNIRWPRVRKNGYYFRFDESPKLKKLNQTWLEDYLEDCFD